MPTIFICYRRDDTKETANRLYERLGERYGESSVFIDVDKLRHGLDFRDQLRNVLDNCDVVLVLIGKHWLADKRLWDVNDFVRIEIEQVLGRQIPIIPVLVDGANMPDAKQLPDALGPFAFRHALEIDTGRRFASDVGDLISAIDQCCNIATSVAVRPRQSRHRWVVATLAAAGAIVLGLTVWLVVPSIRHRSVGHDASAVKVSSSDLPVTVPKKGDGSKIGQAEEPTSEIGYEYPDLHEYLAQHVRSRYVRWQNYSDMATVLAGGKGGTWIVGGGLNPTGEPVEINIATGKWFGRMIPKSEATQEQIQGKMVERTAPPLVWRELPLARLVKAQLKAEAPDAEERRPITGTIDVEIASDVPVDYLALVVEAPTPGDPKVASIASYQHFKETQIPKTIQVSMRLASKVSLQYGARLYLIAFVPGAHSSFYRITKELAWTSSTDVP